MTSLQDRVIFAIARDALIPPGSRVLAAVSGGSDSVALLLLLLEVADSCGFTVAGVGHVNHGLRGIQSDRDETFCRRLAARLGVPFEARRRDVARLAGERRVSIEAAARDARYECLEGMATLLKADRIATGHTRDDQAETFLLRLLRGAGTGGMAGIRPLRGNVVRPLLDVRRDELQAYLRSRHQAHRTDPTNRDVTIPRNWVRHRLLPMLAAHLDADIVEVLARNAAVLRDEASLLDDLAGEAASRIVTDAPGGGLSLDARGLVSLPTGLARLVVRQSLRRLESGRFWGLDHVDQVLALGRAGRRRAAADLPGVRVERNGAGVVLCRRGARSRKAAAGFRVQLAVPGRVELPACRCVIEAERAGRASPQVLARLPFEATPDTAVVDEAAAAGGLAVRSRRPGDRMRPLGLKGSKKLQDVLVDRKVPRDERDRVPLVVDARDRIVWVAGHVVSHDARVTDRTRSVVVLKRKELEEEGDEA